MSKFKKFLTIGALALITSVNSLNVAAHQINNFIQEPTPIASTQVFAQNMSEQEILEKYGNYGQRFINVAKQFQETDEIATMEKTHIFQNMQFKWLYKQAQNLDLLANNNVSIHYNEINKTLSDTRINGFNREVGVAGDQAYFNEQGQCNIDLNVSHEGEMEQLSKNIDLLLLTKFQNETQKEMYRQFIALHEIMHCDFELIANPIHLENADAAANFKFNDLIRSFDNGAYGESISYKTLVNENFADVGSISMLHKIYDKNNPDLEYVLNVIATQREETYNGSYSDKMINHFTHFSIQEVLKSENLEKLVDIKTNQDFMDFAIKIANEGAMKSVLYKTDTSKYQEGLGMHAALDNKQVDTYVGLAVYNKLFTDEPSAHDVMSGKNNAMIARMAELIISKINKSTFNDSFNLLNENKNTDMSSLSQEKIGRIIIAKEVVKKELSEQISHLKSEDIEVKTAFTDAYSVLEQFKSAISENKQDIKMSQTAEILQRMKNLRQNYLSVTPSSSPSLS